jgi:hypothetical protein
MERDRGKGRVGAGKEKEMYIYKYIEKGGDERLCGPEERHGWRKAIKAALHGPRNAEGEADLSLTFSSK